MPKSCHEYLLGLVRYNAELGTRLMVGESEQVLDYQCRYFEAPDGWNMHAPKPQRYCALEIGPEWIASRVFVIAERWLIEYRMSAESCAS